jgi:GT2 family glycosyltransferase
MAAEPAPDQASAPDPRVGVVVLTHNRVHEVVRTVERLLALPARPGIVVVDNASTDGTAAALRRRFPTIRCVSLAENLGAAGRNVGVQLCDRPYVALCDDDTWWEPGSLKRAADLLDAYPRLAVVSGRVLVGPDERLDPACQQMASSPLRPSSPLPGPALLGFIAGASMVRRSAFLEVGGFERRFFVGGEEELLALALVSSGWELAYIDDIVVRHYPSSRRDRSGRRRTVLRNHLWVTWLRRPLGPALARTLAAVRHGLADRATREALADAARGLRWVLGRRRVIPGHVERRLRQLELSGRR